VSGAVTRLLRPLVRRLYRVPSPTFNHASHRNLRRFAGALSPAARSQGARILNLGGGGRPLPPSAVDRFVRQATINLDIVGAPGVACVGDAQRLPFASGSFAGVVSTAVLEHLREPGRAVDELTRVARPGALVYVEVPFLQGYHASPDDYQRFTSSGLRHLFRNHAEVEVGVCVGPSSALSWVLRGYLKGLLSGFSRNCSLERMAEFVAAWLTVPIKYLDRLVAERPAAEDLASGFYVFARVTKP
jgi:SAM-dependent methyltransferase